MEKENESLSETIERMKREDMNDYMEMKLEIELFEIHRAIDNMKEYFNELLEKLQRDSRRIDN